MVVWLFRIYWSDKAFKMSLRWSIECFIIFLPVRGSVAHYLTMPLDRWHMRSEILLLPVKIRPISNLWGEEVADHAYGLIVTTLVAPRCYQIGPFRGKKIWLVHFECDILANDIPSFFPLHTFFSRGCFPDRHMKYIPRKYMKHSIWRVRLLFVYNMTNHWWCINIWGLLYKGGWALKDASRPSRDC